MCMQVCAEESLCVGGLRQGTGICVHVHVHVQEKRGTCRNNRDIRVRIFTLVHEEECE
jgi:hypothetical protein